MCGIAGKVNYSDPPSVPTVEKINAAMVHRGPDFGQVCKIDAAAVFGHRRLSIIDLSPGANQPMQDPQKLYTIVYNGEVYNFQEIRQELEREGFCFRTRSDTEVLLNAYIKWGVRCFLKFNGMFALALWDSRKKECVLARDRMGKKPLYYTLLNNELTFASELSAILRDDRIRSRLTVSVEALNHYFALGYILNPCTFYKEIHKLEPATYMRYSDHGIVEKSEFWNYRNHFADPLNQPEEDTVRQLQGLIEVAVKRRLVSDVPLGAFLSGGLDSSSVVAIAKQHLNHRFHTFSVSFREKSYNEGGDAQFVAQYLDTHHHDLPLTMEADNRMVARAIDCYDEPFSDTSLIPMVEVSRLASQQVKVVLSGDGADEIFGGYITYRADAIKSRFDRFPFPVRRFLSLLLRSWKSETNRKLSLGFKIKQFSKGVDQDYRYAHYSWRELFSEEERIRIIGEEHREEIRDTHPFRRFEKHYREIEACDPLSQHLYVDVKTWLTDDILVKVDRATMASSLEARCPFLDPEVVEYAARIPSRLKLKKAYGKYILREALRAYLPSKVLRKKKSGFNAPVKTWLGDTRENEFKVFNRYVLKRKREAVAA